MSEPTPAVGSEREVAGDVSDLAPPAVGGVARLADHLAGARRMVDEARFRLSRRGYDSVEVDEFLERCAAAIDRLDAPSGSPDGGSERAWRTFWNGEEDLPPAGTGLRSVLDGAGFHLRRRGYDAAAVDALISQLRARADVIEAAVDDEALRLVDVREAEPGFGDDTTPHDDDVAAESNLYLELSGERDEPAGGDGSGRCVDLAADRPGPAETGSPVVERSGFDADRHQRLVSATIELAGALGLRIVEDGEDGDTGGGPTPSFALKPVGPAPWSPTDRWMPPALGPDPSPAPSRSGRGPSIPPAGVDPVPGDEGFDPQAMIDALVDPDPVAGLHPIVRSAIPGAVSQSVITDREAGADPGGGPDPDLSTEPDAAELPSGEGISWLDLDDEEFLVVIRSLGSHRHRAPAPDSDQGDQP